MDCHPNLKPSQEQSNIELPLVILRSGPSVELFCSIPSLNDVVNLEISSESKHERNTEPPEHTEGIHHIENKQEAVGVEEIIDYCIGAIEIWFWITLNNNLIGDIIVENPLVPKSALANWIKFPNREVNVDFNTIACANGLSLHV
jgi:hypothetical protein